MHVATLLVLELLLVLVLLVIVRRATRRKVRGIPCPYAVGWLAVWGKEGRREISEQDGVHLTPYTHTLHRTCPPPPPSLPPSFQNLPLSFVPKRGSWRGRVIHPSCSCSCSCSCYSAA